MTRLASSRCLAENLTADRHIAPAEHAEAFLGDDLFNDRLLVLTLFIVFGEKHKADTIIAFSGHVEAASFYRPS